MSCSLREFQYGRIYGDYKKTTTDPKYNDYHYHGCKDWSWLMWQEPCTLQIPSGVVPSISRLYQAQFHRKQWDPSKPARFGGAVHDEMERLITYYGNAQYAVALRQSIVRAQKWMTMKTRLIVEPDDFSFILCANGLLCCCFSLVPLHKKKKYFPS